MTGSLLTQISDLYKSQATDLVAVFLMTSGLIILLQSTALQSFTSSIEFSAEYTLIGICLSPDVDATTLGV